MSHSITRLFKDYTFFLETQKVGGERQGGEMKGWKHIFPCLGEGEGEKERGEKLSRKFVFSPLTFSITPNWGEMLFSPPYILPKQSKENKKSPPSLSLPLLSLPSFSPPSIFSSQTKGKS